MDCLNAKPTAARVENLGKKLARGGQLRVIQMRFAQSEQILAEQGFGQSHPGAQPVVDAVGHFRRTRLGKGEAKDRFRVGAAQQQAQHPRGQHLCFARPRRCRQPDLRIGPRGNGLIAFHLREKSEIAALNHRGPAILPDASDGHNRCAHNPALAWP